MAYDWSRDMATLARQAASLQERLSARDWQRAQAEAATIRQQMERIERACAYKAATE